jgi:hypothetical protein
MRWMDIPPFAESIAITDLDHLMRTRLSLPVVHFPAQASRLVAYMTQPNDEMERERLLQTVAGWSDAPKNIPLKLGQTQVDWARVADVLNVHHDLSAGRHHEHRGGASVGKAKAIISKTRRAGGRSEASQSESWASFKDVAHLVTAAVIAAADARERMKIKSFGPLALPALQLLQPFVISMMLPEVVLSLGLYLQDYGLRQIPYGREEPLLDPESLWRIPSDINVTPIPPPIRNIDEKARAVLRARRAGNRGKRRR